MIYIGNAFSLQMINTDIPKSLYVSPVNKDSLIEALKENEYMSCIGHQDTANVVSNILGVDIPMNRINVNITNEDILVVAQITGGRLPEGATTIPEGIEIKFLKVSLNMYIARLIRDVIPPKRLKKKNTKGILVEDRSTEKYYFIPYRKSGPIDEKVIDRVFKEIQGYNPSFIPEKKNVEKALIHEYDYVFHISILPYKGGTTTAKDNVIIFNIF